MVQCGHGQHQVLAQSGPSHRGGSPRIRPSDELLNREIFYTLTEAKVLIERWRHEYNTVRPHSSLGYLPPAPVAIEPFEPGSATLRPPQRAREQVRLDPNPDPRRV